MWLGVRDGAGARVMVRVRSAPGNAYGLGGAMAQLPKGRATPGVHLVEWDRARDLSRVWGRGGIRSRRLGYGLG